MIGTCPSDCDRRQHHLSVRDRSIILTRHRSLIFFFFYYLQKEKILIGLKFIGNFKIIASYIYNRDIALKWRMRKKSKVQKISSDFEAFGEKLVNNVSIMYQQHCTILAS